MSEPGGARYRIKPGGSVSGTLTVPGDKSISHRALMLGALAEGDTHISGFLAGEDCLATARALQELGVHIEGPLDTHVLVRGVGAHGLAAPRSPLDMGNAGTAMRLMMGLLAPQKFDSTLIGDASLMRRPMERVAVPLQMMGARIQTHQGRPPVEIRGTPHLRAIHYSLPVASAQVKSAVLLAGLAASGRTHLTEPVPSRDHTERMLGAFGVQLAREGRSITMEGGQTLRGTAVRVPADFSSAAFFLVAGCLAADRPLTLINIGVNPTRIGLIELLRRMGADIRLHPYTVPGGPNPEPVADSVVERILETARFAPSGGNRQGWRVVVVQDSEVRTAIRECYLEGWYEYLAQAAAGLVPWAVVTDREAEQRAVLGAPALAADAARGPGGLPEHLDEVPVMLVLLADLRMLAAVDRDLGRYTMAGGASIYPFAWSILLAARSEGLAGVMTTMAIREEARLRAILHVTDDLVVAGVIALGHPVHQPNKLRRAPVGEFTTVDRFDGPVFGAS